MSETRDETATPAERLADVMDEWEQLADERHWPGDIQVAPQTFLLVIDSVDAVRRELGRQIADNARLAAEVAGLREERDAAQRAARDMLVSASVNEVARQRLAEHEHREARVYRAIAEASDVIGRLTPSPEQPGMRAGMSARYVADVDANKLARLRQDLVALAAGKEDGRPRDRRNYDRRGDAVWVCDGLHDKHEPCEWRPATPDEVAAIDPKEARHA